MERLLISSDNKNELEYIARDLASAYQIDFGNEPWNEQSICSDGFSRELPGTYCTSCRQTRKEAYPVEQLVSQWEQIIDEDGVISVAFNQDAAPINTTIARPTTARELLVRKYNDTIGLSDWLDEKLPQMFVWIEDTFADLQIQPNGNLRDRGDVLRQVMGYYGLDAATRTLAPAIISATARDVGKQTDMFVGTRNINGPRGEMMRSTNRIPDPRTLLRIDRTVL